MNSSRQAHDENDGTRYRKPYRKPQVQIYGDQREITQTVGNKGNNDSVATGPSRTQP